MDRSVLVRACLCIGVLCASPLAGCGSSSTSTSVTQSGPGPAGQNGYYVYWDQNEELDFVAMPSGQQGRMVAPWDVNGQMCIVPDGSGRFSTAYNPTLPDQRNPGGLKPYMQPPVGEVLWNRNGSFSGQTISVSGPYKLPGHSAGGDIPPDAKGNHAYNNNGTYTGCVFDAHGNLFATDIATAQGPFPTPDDGRLVEWFAPSYTAFCVVLGPNKGGDGPHHVDGTGGLKEPGLLTLDSNGDVLLPQAGAANILRVDHSTLPSSASDCTPDGLMAAGKVHTSEFITVAADQLAFFPESIVRDPSCGCWAVGSVIGDPAIAWYDDHGQPLLQRGTVPGTKLGDNSGYNPFGLAFAPDGTLFFVDVHITCVNNQLSNCGPVDYGGRIMKVNFVGGKPSAPVQIATGFDFPISVTVCVPAKQTCPWPTTVTPPGSGPSENNAPATGPSTTAPATAADG
jgi:hypothetical protein